MFSYNILHTNNRRLGLHPLFLTTCVVGTPGPGWLLSDESWVTLPPATGRRSGGTQGQRWWAPLLLGTAAPSTPVCLGIEALRCCSFFLWELLVRWLAGCRSRSSGGMLTWLCIILNISMSLAASLRSARGSRLRLSRISVTLVVGR